MKHKLIICLFALAFAARPLFCQEEKTETSVYRFTIEKELNHTPVRDQARSSTCWCFAALSLMEAELLRTGRGEFDLSEMFVVRHTYPMKAENYIRMHGNANFGGGGYYHDLIEVMKTRGLVPESVYTGMNIGESRHNHGELHSVIRGMLDGILKRRGSRLTPRWKEAVSAVLDVYMGVPPESFEFEGARYTPKSFLSDRLQLDPDDYIEITSYSHHPYYQTCRLALPDNWMYFDQFYNVPLEVFSDIIETSLQKGYTVVWGGDVSNEDFSTRQTGYGIVPLKDREAMTEEERKAKITEPVTEKTITQALRQQAYDSFSTTDDHAMHLVGLATDQLGNRFYLTKNSHSTDRKFGGYVYLSRPYVLLHGIAIMVHKAALPKTIKKQLGL